MKYVRDFFIGVLILAWSPILLMVLVLYGFWYLGNDFYVHVIKGEPYDDKPDML